MSGTENPAIFDPLYNLGEEWVKCLDLFKFSLDLPKFDSHCELRKTPICCFLSYLHSVVSLVREGFSAKSEIYVCI